MTSDCIINHHDGYSDEPFKPATDNGEPWPEPPPIPNRRDLLDFNQAIEVWKATAADLAGWVNAGRLLAYKQSADGFISRFNWFRLPTGDSWQNTIEWLLFQPVPGFDLEHETRYLSYEAVKKILEQHNPKPDFAKYLAAGFIGKAEIDNAGICTEDWPMPGRLAISLTHPRLNQEILPDCLYIKSQIEALVNQRKVRKERTRKNLAWRKKFGDDAKVIRKAILDAYKTMTQEKVAEALGIPLYYVKDETDGEPHHPTGPSSQQL